MSEKNDEIVRIATAANSVQAHLWEQTLKEANIDCKVVGEFLSTGLGNTPGMPNEIWVHHADQERALEVLESVRDSEEEEE